MCFSTDREGLLLILKDGIVPFYSRQAPTIPMTAHNHTVFSKLVRDTYIFEQGNSTLHSHVKGKKKAHLKQLIPVPYVRSFLSLNKLES